MHPPPKSATAPDICILDNLRLSSRMGIEVWHYTGQGDDGSCVKIKTSKIMLKMMRTLSLAPSCMLMNQTKRNLKLDHRSEENYICSRSFFSNKQFEI